MSMYNRVIKVVSKKPPTNISTCFEGLFLSQLYGISSLVQTPTVLFIIQWKQAVAMICSEKEYLFFQQEKEHIGPLVSIW